MDEKGLYEEDAEARTDEREEGRRHMKHVVNAHVNVRAGSFQKRLLPPSLAPLSVTLTFVTAGRLPG